MDISIKTKFSIYEYIESIFHINTSLTGNANLKLLKSLKNILPLTIIDCKSQKKVFDWEIPLEWNLIDAYVKNSNGEKVIDLKKSNLHVMGYSDPINIKLDLKDLKKHLHTLPDYPDWIPYRTSYYDRDWGFCLSHNSLSELLPGKYHAYIDSELKKGFLRYGEVNIEGQSEETILLSTYTCHPSMGNDNLSGVGVLAKVCKFLLGQTNLKFSYKCIFVPETIGAITWLNYNQPILDKIKAGLVLYCLGDRGGSTYKKSRYINSLIDQVAELVLKNKNDKLIPFNPTGSDERQYCSPGINLPMGAIMRTPNSEFDEYHTSADNLDFISSDHLEDSYNKIIKMLGIMENNNSYKNLFPQCEPQLGKRGLYRKVGGQKINAENQTAIKWILNYSDGKHSLIDISKISGIDFWILNKSARILERHELISEI